MRHHRFHYFGHMLHQTLRFFVIPALLGVIGGLLASAVGMMVGQLISYVWLRFHRGGVRGHATGRDLGVVEEVVIVHEMDGEEPNEKDGLLLDVEEALAFVEPPPEYGDEKQ
jgi:hypothetical protein